MSTPPFTRGDWVAQIGDDQQPVFGTVKDCYPDDLQPGAHLIDLTCYAAHGERIGRVSPTLDGPAGYEPCCPAANYARIERPAFPLKTSRVMPGWRHLLRFIS